MERLMTTSDLIFANLRAKKANQNAVLPATFVDTLDPDGIHVLANGVLIDDGMFVRCSALTKHRDSDTPVQTQIDVPVASYNGLLTYEQFTQARLK